MATIAATQSQSAGVPRRQGRALFARRALPFLLLGPSLLLLAAFTYIPILRVLGESLFETSHATAKISLVGLGNYAALLSDRAFINSVTNNLTYAVGTVPISMALALLFVLAIGTPVLIYTNDGGAMDVLKQKASATGQAQQDRFQQISQ